MTQFHTSMQDPQDNKQALLCHRYFLLPKKLLLQDRKDSATSCQADIKTLKVTQAAVQRTLDTVENEFRELLQHSPALQQAVSRSG